MLGVLTFIFESLIVNEHHDLSIRSSNFIIDVISQIEKRHLYLQYRAIFYFRLHRNSTGALYN